MKAFLTKNYQKLLLGVIFIALFFIPFFWNFTVGGDDGKFYYIFPFEFLKNFTTENIFNDLGNFNPQQYIIPFAFLLSILNKIFFFVGTQKIAFGLNLSCGFLFFYLFLSIFDKDVLDKTNSFAAKITASLFYSLSIFSYYTLWGSQLFSMYLIPLFPLALYLFFKSIQEKNIIYIIFVSLILSLFSVVTLSIAWSGALVIAALPLIAYFFWVNKKRFIGHLAVLICLFALLNVYWLVGYILSSSSGNVVAIETAFSNDFAKGNAKLIEAVSVHNSVLYPFFNLFHKDIQIDYGWPQEDIYINYLLKLLPLNLLFLIVVILPVFFYKKTNKSDAKIYSLALLSWIVVLFLYTAKIDEWGLPVFIWLTNTIPGFVIFRNMYDKFGVAMSFSYAFLLFISLKILSNTVSIKKYLKISAYVFLSVVILLNALPFMIGAFYNLPIWTTNNTYSRINNFNDDFYKLTDYVEKLDTTSKFLWLPLNQAGYIVVSDRDNKNYYYNGVSLLKTLANKNDYSGTLSFYGYDKGDMQEYIVYKQYEKFFDLFKTFNIGYIIVNKDINKELQKSYLYGYFKRGDLYDNQMSPEFLDGILGDKIKDFGNRYSLYSINTKYLMKVLGADNIEFQKINNDKYRIYLKNLTTAAPLTFLSWYNNYWSLFLEQQPNDNWCRDGKYYSISGQNITECQSGKSSSVQDLGYLNKKTVFNDTHETTYKYANKWIIDPVYIKEHFDKNYYKENADGSINIELTLYFKPQLYFYLGAAISCLTFIICVIYLLWFFLRKALKKQ